MGYGKNRIWKQENRSYSNNADPRRIGKMFGNIIDNKIQAEKQNNIRMQRAILIQEEKGFTSQLTQLGKLCCYVEHFDMIGLNDQNISSVGPFEDPRKTQSFKNGYDLAGKLIKAGFTEQNYHDFAKCYEDTFNIMGKSKHR